MNWIYRGHYQETLGKDCSVTLELRPSYCDRGRFIAKLHASGELGRDIDEQDLWPRYYFDEERAKLEIEAWLKFRKLNMTHPAAILIVAIAAILLWWAREDLK